MHAASSATDGTKVTNAPQLRHHVKACVATLWASVDTYVQQSKSQKTSVNDRQMREPPSPQTGSYVFVDKPPITTKSESSAKALTSNTYSKLQRRASGKHRNFAMQASNVALDE